MITMMASTAMMAIYMVFDEDADAFFLHAELYRRQVIDKAVAALELIIKRGIGSGHFRPVNPRLAIRNLMGPVLAHFILGQVFGVDKDSPVPAEVFIESHLDILLHGLSAEGA